MISFLDFCNQIGDSVVDKDFVKVIAGFNKMTGDEIAGLIDIERNEKDTETLIGVWLVQIVYSLYDLSLQNAKLTQELAVQNEMIKGIAKTNVDKFAGLAQTFQESTELNQRVLEAVKHYDQNFNALIAELAKHGQTPKNFETKET